MNLRYLLSSLALVAPCFWTPRIEAGDLSSHVYNAWLAQLIAHGGVPGLSIQPQWTNVLFDLELQALWGLGPVAAHKIAVAAAVLIFVWGAFAFAAVVARRRPWFLMPLLGVLAYGWVFHVGFFNFYISLGLAFWALALAWHPGRARLAGAAAILLLAMTAHALPVVWSLGAILYRRFSPLVRPRYRWRLVAAAAALLLVVRWLIEWRMTYTWFPYQLILATGSDQVWIYGSRDRVLQLGLLVVWGVLLARVWKQGPKRLAVSMPLQIAVITGIAIVFIPDKILLPGYRHSIVYLAERMSLAVAVCACAVLASARPRPLELGLNVIFSAAFCAFLCIDSHNLNQIEDDLAQALQQVPAGSRVVSTLSDAQARGDPMVHMIDRACIGRCFSYANYEASTAQFRIRARAGNPVVVTRYADSYALQTGVYRVKPADLPLYAVTPRADGGFTVRLLQADEPVQIARAK